MNASAIERASSCYLSVLAVDKVLLPVQEPFWNLELQWVLDDVDDAFKFIRVELTGAEVTQGIRGIEVLLWQNLKYTYRLLRSTSALRQTVQA